jgi:hypothetical protein
LIASFNFLYLFYLSYEVQDIALNCGMMLRECCRYEELTKLMITSEQFYKFFEYVELSTFDIASDAFLTFRVSFIYNFFSFIHSFSLKLNLMKQN